MVLTQGNPTSSASPRTRTQFCQRERTKTIFCFFSSPFSLLEPSFPPSSMFQSVMFPLASLLSLPLIFFSPYPSIHSFITYSFPFFILLFFLLTLFNHLSHLSFHFYLSMPCWFTSPTLNPLLFLSLCHSSLFKPLICFLSFLLYQSR